MTFSRRESLKNRGEMICENAWIIVTCDYHLKTTKFSDTWEDIKPTPSQKPLHVSRTEQDSLHETSACVRQTEHTSGGLE
ncbi:hypothetical protein TNCV_1563081 [Trichonephila clavipes]|nr:hypothetical protein TNCV_1563081 [Trichonephila clavipes]